ncbi:MAG TPA: dTDP-4-amino-4,6-dideoxyglucose formyltransferase [Candidatus Hydrogenedentes bacterium]|nr:dTDP-4-amino-4,6-dideoxyglucose formyltransferase [Candidatus Hydrogenedentota bacterium]
MNTLILTDNIYSLELARELKNRFLDIDICQSPNGLFKDVPVCDVATDIDKILHKYDLLISLHCTQIFPQKLIERIRCINVHPGFNPYNRGWYPSVFSIINAKPAGVTIHEIDSQIDHGKIIVQQECPIYSWDTSGSLYERITGIEHDLLFAWFERIRHHVYELYEPSSEGNINFKKDYERLKELNLDTQGSYRQFLNHLRALTHGAYKNAYFIDEEGNRVYVRIDLERA